MLGRDEQRVKICLSENFDRMLLLAMAALAGLRRGEIEGLDGPDFHDGALWVSRASGMVANCPTKTRKSMAPMPVIRWLAERLEIGCVAEIPQQVRFLQPAMGLEFQSTTC